MGISRFRSGWREATKRLVRWARRDGVHRRDTRRIPTEINLLYTFGGMGLYMAIMDLR
jgi:hypothetical protein